MAQKPAKRHVLANARIEVGFSQVALAKLLGCSTATVQRIEQGTLALSEELALKVQEALEISATWLLANDPARPPTTPGGGLWNKLSYEFARASRPKMDQFNYYLRDDAERGELFEDFRAREIYAKYRAMMKKARGSPKQTILMHRVERAFAELEEDFPPDKENFEELRQLGIEKALAEYEPDVLESAPPLMNELPPTKLKNDRSPNVSPSELPAR